MKNVKFICLLQSSLLFLLFSYFPNVYSASKTANQKEGLIDILSLWEKDFERIDSKPVCHKNFRTIDFTESKQSPDNLTRGGWHHSFRLECKNEFYEIETVTQFGGVTDMIIESIKGIDVCKSIENEKKTYESWGYKYEQVLNNEFIRFYLKKQLKGTKFGVFGQEVVDLMGVFTFISRENINREIKGLVQRLRATLN